MGHIFRFLGQPARNGHWTITGDELQHLRKVLRLQTGDMVEVMNGAGRWVSGSLRDVSGAEAVVAVGQEHNDPPVGFPLVIAVGALKPKVLDDFIPTLVELGVDHLSVFYQAGTEKARLSPKVEERWQKIILAASKQAKRSHLPKLTTFSSLEAFLASDIGGKCNRLLFTRDAESQPVMSLPLAPEPIVAVIGGEKGLNDAECGILKRADFLPVQLGEHVLRATTALVAAVAVLDSRRLLLTP